LLCAACASRPRANAPAGWQDSSAQGYELASQARAAEGRGDLDKAIELYTRSAGASPDVGAVWNNLGIALMSRGRGNDFVDAGSAFQHAASLLPTDPTPYRNLGLLYQRRGFGEESLRYFEQALVINPQDLDSLRGAARAGKLLRTTSHEALDRLRRAQMIETDPRWLELIKLERIRVESDLRDMDERT
jgi:tetratricopeptide (TPR) repeat protein